MNMSVFVMMFSGLRQSLAVSAGIVAYEFVKQRKPKRFILIALIALGLHHTAFMVLLMYPLYYLKINKRNLFTIIPVIAAVFIFNKQIFAVLVDILSNIFGEKYDVEVTVTNAYTFIILFILFAVFSYVIPDEEKMDAEALGLRNYLLFAVLLQCFAPVHALSMRLNYGNLSYPAEWKDNVKVVTSEENGNYRIAFNAIFGETGVPLYAITFGKCEKGFLLGEVPYGDSLVCVYCEDYTSTSVEHLTQDQQDKYSKMCGDINTIISHLVYDCGMIIN